jgi:hypothetical protein
MESHADGIFFAAVMKETNGHFQVDLERTWKMNRASFTWSPKARGTKAKRISSNDADALSSELHWFVENAALAKYCGRPNLQTMPGLACHQKPSRNSNASSNL